MKTRAVLGSLFFALVISACGGSIEPTGSSSSGGSGTPNTPPSPGAPVAPAPPSTGVHPTPGPTGPTAGTWSQTASGCSNFTIFASHSTGRRFLVVTAAKADLGIANLGDSVTIDLASTSGGPSASIAVDTFARAPQEAPYCTDIIVDSQTPSRAVAAQGTATFTISSIGREGDSYAVTVTLQGVVVRDASGALEKIPDITYASVGVGWLPG